MSRQSSATLAASSLWSEIETAARDFGKMFLSRSAGESCLEDLERQQDRVRLNSRHWLMG